MCVSKTSTKDICIWQPDDPVPEIGECHCPAIMLECAVIKHMLGSTTCGDPYTYRKHYGNKSCLNSERRLPYCWDNLCLGFDKIMLCTETVSYCM